MIRLCLYWSLSMKREDIRTYEVIIALFTISTMADGMFEEIDECDLPEMLRSDYRSVKSSICALTESIEQYRDEKMDTFMSACED